MVMDGTFKRALGPVACDSASPCRLAAGDPEGVI
jgi:hypothetical protein